MWFLLCLFVILAILFVYHVYSIQFSTRKLPPGLFVAPFGLGNIPAGIYVDPQILLDIYRFRPWEWFEKVDKMFGGGGIVSFQAGGFYGVVITKWELFQEVANMDEFSIKFSHKDLTYPRTFNKELGLIFASTPEMWVEMRKFTVRTLRDFGFGKRHTQQSAIEAETNELVKQFNNVIKNEGGVMSVRTTFVLSVLNVLWCMAAGERYEHSDPMLRKLVEVNYEMVKSTTFGGPLLAVSYFLRKLFPAVFREDARQKGFDNLNEFTRQLVERRKAEGMYKSSPQNYIDVFLQKIYAEEGSKNPIYTEEQLQAMLADLLQAGSTTTNSTLNYALLYLIRHPEVQKRCQDEIDNNVPRHLTPTIEDIDRMQYFRAFVLEVHRHANVVPNPVPRTVPKDWNVAGYTIPKGAIIFSNHYSVMFDEKYWGDPQEFRPERFINEQGHFVHDKRVVHFGFGKRICIGITLSNTVIPIFLATLIQQFNFSVVPGTEPPPLTPEIGISLSPLEYKVLITKR